MTDQNHEKPKNGFNISLALSTALLLSTTSIPVWSMPSVGDLVDKAKSIASLGKKGYDEYSEVNAHYEMFLDALRNPQENNRFVPPRADMRAKPMSPCIHNTRFDLVAQMSHIQFAQLLYEKYLVPGLTIFSMGQNFTRKPSATETYAVMKRIHKPLDGLYRHGDQDLQLQNFISLAARGSGTWNDKLTWDVAKFFLPSFYSVLTELPPGTYCIGNFIQNPAYFAVEFYGLMPEQCKDIAKVFAPRRKVNLPSGVYRNGTWMGEKKSSEICKFAPFEDKRKQINLRFVYWTH